MQATLPTSSAVLQVPGRNTSPTRCFPGAEAADQPPPPLLPPHRSLGRSPWTPGGRSVPRAQQREPRGAFVGACAVQAAPARTVADQHPAGALAPSGRFLRISDSEGREGTLRGLLCRGLGPAAACRRPHPHPQAWTPEPIAVSQGQASGELSHQVPNPNATARRRRSVALHACGEEERLLSASPEVPGC